mmetsp:Transcript_137317/g.383062  ORF Transcript_137317/g.383062 Transcript_137317/m.383062 type:complete len:218 (-) Transcript_137317:1102-1755(-)
MANNQPSLAVSATRGCAALGGRTSSPAGCHACPRSSRSNTLPSGAATAARSGTLGPSSKSVARNAVPCAAARNRGTAAVSAQCSTPPPEPGEGHCATLPVLVTTRNLARPQLTPRNVPSPGTPLSTSRVAAPVARPAATSAGTTAPTPTTPIVATEPSGAHASNSGSNCSETGQRTANGTWGWTATGAAEIAGRAAGEGRPRRRRCPTVSDQCAPRS